MKQVDKDNLALAKFCHENQGDEDIVIKAWNAALAHARSGDAVAWVEVKNTHEGPYEFHGIQLLAEGKHHLFTHSQPAEQSSEVVSFLILNI